MEEAKRYNIYKLTICIVYFNKNGSLGLIFECLVTRECHCLRGLEGLGWVTCWRKYVHGSGHQAQSLSLPVDNVALSYCSTTRLHAAMVIMD